MIVRPPYALEAGGAVAAWKPLKQTKYENHTKKRFLRRRKPYQKPPGSSKHPKPLTLNPKP